MKLLNVCLIVFAVGAFAFPGCVASNRGTRFSNCETKRQCHCFKCQQRTVTQRSDCGCFAVDNAGAETKAGQVQVVDREPVSEEAQNVRAMVQASGAEAWDGNKANKINAVESAPYIEGDGLANNEPAIIEAAPLQESQVESPVIETVKPINEAVNVSNRRLRSSEVETVEKVKTVPAKVAPVVNDSVNPDVQQGANDSQEVSGAIPEPFNSNSDWNLPSDEQLETTPSNHEEGLEPAAAPSSTSEPTSAEPLEATPVGFPLRRAESEDRVASSEDDNLALSSKEAPSRVHVDYEVVDRRLVLKARPVGQNRVHRASKDVVQRGTIPAISAKLKRIVPGNDLRHFESSEQTRLAEQEVVAEQKVVAIKQETIAIEPEPIDIADVPELKASQMQVVAVPEVENQKRRVLLRAVPHSGSVSSRVHARIVPAGNGSIEGNFRFTDGLGKPTSQVQNAQSLHAQVSQPEIQMSVRPSVVEESWHERTARVAPEEETALAPWRQR